MFLSQELAEAAALHRFQREAKLASSLNHHRWTFLSRLDK